MVILAGKDLIADTQVIANYLTETDGWDPETGTGTERSWESGRLDVLWFGNLDHGQVFGSKSTRTKLVDVVKMYSADEELLRAGVDLCGVAVQQEG